MRARTSTAQRSRAGFPSSSRDGGLVSLTLETKVNMRRATQQRLSSMDRTILAEAARIRKKLNEDGAYFRNVRTGERYFVSDDDYYDFKRDMQATGDWSNLEEERRQYSSPSIRRPSSKQLNFLRSLYRQLGKSDEEAQRLLDYYAVRDMSHIRNEINNKKAILAVQRQERSANLATDKQVNYISVLRKKLGIPDDREATKKMTSKEASSEISRLKGML